MAHRRPMQAARGHLPPARVVSDTWSPPECDSTVPLPSSPTTAKTVLLVFPPTPPPSPSPDAPARSEQGDHRVLRRRGRSKRTRDQAGPVPPRNRRGFERDNVMALTRAVQGGGPPFGPKNRGRPRVRHSCRRLLAWWLRGGLVSYRGW